MQLMKRKSGFNTLDCFGIVKKILTTIFQIFFYFMHLDVYLYYFTVTIIFVNLRWSVFILKIDPYSFRVLILILPKYSKYLVLQDIFGCCYFSSIIIPPYLRIEIFRELYSNVGVAWKSREKYLKLWCIFPYTKTYLYLLSYFISSPTLTQLILLLVNVSWSPDASCVLASAVPQSLGSIAADQRRPNKGSDGNGGKVGKLPMQEEDM